MPEKQVTGTQAIDRACDLLIRVIEAKSSITLSELVQQTGLAKGTASRMCSALERSGLVGRTNNGGIVVGPLLNQFAVFGGAYAPMVEKYSSVLREIAEQTTEDTNLAVVGHMGSVVCIDQADGQHMLGQRNWVGNPIQSHCTSIGKVFLAWGACPVPNELVKHTDHTITDLKLLQEELILTRQRGYAVARNELELGLVAIAVPVFDEYGKVSACISIAGAAERISVDDEVVLANLMVNLIRQHERTQGVA